MLASKPLGRSLRAPSRRRPGLEPKSTPHNRTLSINRASCGPGRPAAVSVGEGRPPPARPILPGLLRRPGGLTDPAAASTPGVGVYRAERKKPATLRRTRPGHVAGQLPGFVGGDLQHLVPTAVQIPLAVLQHRDDATAFTTFVDIGFARHDVLLGLTEHLVAIHGGRRPQNQAAYAPVRQSGLISAGGLYVGKVQLRRSERYRSIRVQAPRPPPMDKIKHGPQACRTRRRAHARRQPWPRAASAGFPGLLRWGHHPLSSAPAAPVSRCRASLRKPSIPGSIRERN